MEPGIEDGPAEEWPRYECMFCQYRSAEKSVGCPRCGAAYGFMERSAAQGMRMANGSLFIIIGVTLLSLSVWMTVETLAGRASVDTWLFWPALYGLSLLFLAGGVSALFGRLWLMRFFMAALGGGGRAPRSKGR